MYCFYSRTASEIQSGPEIVFALKILKCESNSVFEMGHIVFSFCPGSETCERYDPATGKT